MSVGPICLEAGEVPAKDARDSLELTTPASLHPNLDDVLGKAVQCATQPEINQQEPES